MLSLISEPAACFLFCCSCACFSASTDRCATEPAGAAVSRGRAAPVVDVVSGRLCVGVARGKTELGSAPCCDDDEADAPAYCARMEAAHAAEYDDAS